MRNQKGITLIALIITIIVMLILVAVTINVALNGGIFDNAKNASDKTQRQAEKEELIAKMVGAYTVGGRFATSSVGELPGGAKWCNEDTEAWSENLNVSPTGNGDWIITTNNNKFYIDKNGSVLDSKPQESVIITAEQIAENGMFIEDAYCFLTISQLSNAEQILNLKNNTTANTNSMGWKYFNKISCSDSSLTNKSNEEFADLDEEDGDYYWIGFTESEDTPMLLIKICKDETFMTDENFQLDSFKNITFSISGSN